MKFIGRVSLFCIVGLLGFAACIVSNSAYLHLFYPNRQENGKFQPYTQELEQDPSSTKESAPDGSLPTDSQRMDVITCDTIFSIEEYDRNTDSIAQHEEDIPGKYIGMDRVGFVDAMAAYELSPPLEEQQRGLISVEVLSFSARRVEIRKNYQMIEEPAEELFYLVAENHYITVYREDMKSVYLYTDICVENLPVYLQEEIIQRKLISGESTLYHFLESYSS